MTLHRAYVAPSHLKQASVNVAFELPSDVQHRLLRVLRLGEGDEVELFDGQGLRVSGVLGNDGSLVVRAVAQEARQGPRLILAQALVKQDKLETLVQDASEIGAHAVMLFVSAHSTVKVTERTPRQIERLQKIAIDASRQCERSDVLELLGPLSFAALLGECEKRNALVLVGDPRSVAVRWDELELQKQDAIVLVVGPEGGLASAEHEALLALGARAVRYAPHVLRTETAGLVGLSVIQSRLS